MKKAVSTVGLLFVSLLIAACTPPMPPEFKADLAERYVTCVPGEVTVSTTPELAEVTQSWVDGLSANCADLVVTVLDPAVDIDTPADVFLNAPGQTPACTAVASSPVGIDAAAVTVTVEGLDGVVFSPALLHRALSGGMTSWADPELQDLNPDIELTDTPVLLRAATRSQDIAALNEWMTRIDSSGWPGTPSGLVANDAFESDAVLAELEVEGTLAIVPASFVANNSTATAGIQTEAETEAVFLNVETVISAGTQLVAATSGSNVTAALDPSLAPAPPAGSDIASLPWQALNQFTLTVCAGANELAGKAFARYALRLDSQGVMLLSGYAEIPEQVRLIALDAVSIGLPEPSAPPEGSVETGPTDFPSEFPSDDPTAFPSDEPLEEPLEEEVTDAATPEPTS